MKALQEAIQTDILTINKRLKKCTNKQKFYEILETVSYLLEYIELFKLDIDYPSEFEYEISKFKSDSYGKKMDKLFISAWKKHKAFNYRLARSFRQVAHEYGYIDEHYNYYEHLNQEDTIDLALDYLSDYSEEIYKYAKYLLDQNRIFLSEGLAIDSVGRTIEGKDTIDTLILMDKSDTVFDFSVFIHEIIHAYLDKINKHDSGSKTNHLFLINFNEVYSEMIELDGIDYLRRINFNKKDIHTLAKQFDDSLITYIRDFKWMVKQEIDKHSWEINRIYQSIEAYTYGGILAYEFYHQLQQDRDKGKENVLNFMLASKDYDREYLLNNFGLKERDILSQSTLRRYLHRQ